MMAHSDLIFLSLSIYSPQGLVAHHQPSDTMMYRRMEAEVVELLLAEVVELPEDVEAVEVVVEVVVARRGRRACPMQHKAQGGLPVKQQPPKVMMMMRWKKICMLMMKRKWRRT